MTVNFYFTINFYSTSKPLHMQYQQCQCQPSSPGAQAIGKIAMLQIGIECKPCLEWNGGKQTCLQIG